MSFIEIFYIILAFYIKKELVHFSSNKQLVKIKCHKKLHFVNVNIVKKSNLQRSDATHKCHSK